MLCPHCLDNGKEVEMEHVTGTMQGYQDGNHYDISTCANICPACGREDECSGGHEDDPEPEESEPII